MPLGVFSHSVFTMVWGFFQHKHEHLRQACSSHPTPPFSPVLLCMYVQICHIHDMYTHMYVFMMLFTRLPSSHAMSTPGMFTCYEYLQYVYTGHHGQGSDNYWQNQLVYFKCRKCFKQLLALGLWLPPTFPSHMPILSSFEFAYLAFLLRPQTHLQTRVPTTI